MNKKPTYRKRTQRTHALDSDYFADCQELDNLLSGLRRRAGKTAKQWRLDCRKAHSIEARQKSTKRANYRRLGSSASMPDNVHQKLDNRYFKVSELDCRKFQLDFTPRFKLVGGRNESEFCEIYRKDRRALDASQQKRSKN